MKLKDLWIPGALIAVFGIGFFLGMTQVNFGDRVFIIPEGKTRDDFLLIPDGTKKSDLVWANQDNVVILPNGKNKKDMVWMTVADAAELYDSMKQLGIQIDGITSELNASTRPSTRPATQPSTLPATRSAQTRKVRITFPKVDDPIYETDIRNDSVMIDHDIREHYRLWGLKEPIQWVDVP